MMGSSAGAAPYFFFLLRERVAVTCRRVASTRAETLGREGFDLGAATGRVT